MKTKFIEVTEKEREELIDSIKTSLDEYKYQAGYYSQKAANDNDYVEDLEQAIDDVYTCENLLKKL